MTHPFNLAWNSHYDFQDPVNLDEIQKQQAFDVCNLFDMMAYQTGGGDVIVSPWGENRTLDAGLYTQGFVYSLEPQFVVNPETLEKLQSKPYEFCRKELIVKPGFQLSLQRHRGRQEYWAVEEGILTVILDGIRIDVPSGKGIFIPQGAVHCMNNASDKAVKVIELQTGICREQDNVRLLDSSIPRRVVYPLTSENEFISARLYADLQEEISRKFGTDNHPHSTFLRK